MVAEKWSYAQVAVKFRVTRHVVGNIIRRSKLDGGYLGSIQAKENSKLEKHQAVVTAVQKFIDDDKHIWRASQIVGAVRA